MLCSTLLVSVHGPRQIVIPESRTSVEEHSRVIIPSPEIYVIGRDSIRRKESWTRQPKTTYITRRETPAMQKKQCSIRGMDLRCNTEYRIAIPDCHYDSLILNALPPVNVETTAVAPRGGVDNKHVSIPNMSRLTATTQPLASEYHPQTEASQCGMLRWRISIVLHSPIFLTGLAHAHPRSLPVSLEGSHPGQPA